MSFQLLQTYSIPPNLTNHHDLWVNLIIHQTPKFVWAILGVKPFPIRHRRPKGLKMWDSEARNRSPPSSLTRFPQSHSLVEIGKTNHSSNVNKIPPLTSWLVHEWLMKYFRKGLLHHQVFQRGFSNGAFWQPEEFSIPLQKANNPRFCSHCSSFLPPSRVPFSPILVADHEITGWWNHPQPKWLICSDYWMSGKWSSGLHMNTHCGTHSVQRKFKLYICFWKLSGDVPGS